MSTTEIEVRRPRPQALAAALPAKVQYAKALADSGLLPKQYQGWPANVLWAMEYGEMLGLSPMAAITGVHVIEGKPSASAGLISALVRRAGHKLRVRGDAKSATCQIVRADDPDYTFEVTFTMDDAKVAGLTGKPVWKQYGPSMLKARAITQCARDACEEALFGLHYTPEELGAEVDEDGAVVGQIMDEPAQSEPEPDDPWLTGAIEAAPDLSDLDACGAMWRKSVEKVKAGELTVAQAARVQDLLRPRIEHLKAAAGQQQAEAAEAEAEPVAADLDPADPWAIAIEGLASAEDAEVLLADLVDQLGRGEIEADRFGRVEEAILARFPKAGREAEAA